MATKTVRLDDAVYERVKAHKRADETYSEAINRLIGDWSLLDLAGTMSKAEATEHETAVRASEDAGIADVETLVDREETTGTGTGTGK